MPSGNEDDFQGVGDTTLEPYFNVAYAIGAHDVHAAAGMDVNSGDLAKTRARYGLGATLQIIPQLAFVPELIGSSGVATASEDATKPVFADTLRPNGQPRLVGFQTVATDLPRTDIVDLAVTFKVNAFQDGVAFGGAIVPLNKDGLRADVIPTGGVQCAF